MRRIDGQAGRDGCRNINMRRNIEVKEKDFDNVCKYNNAEKRDFLKVALFVFSSFFTLTREASPLPSQQSCNLKPLQSPKACS